VGLGPVVPEYPALISVYESILPAAIIVDNNLGYFLTAFGLNILDLNNLENPILIGSCSTPGYALNVSIEDNFAYIVDAGEGLQIMDITNPEIPEIVRKF